MNAPETISVGVGRPPGPDPIAAWRLRAAWHRRTALLPLGYLAAAAIAGPLSAAGVLSGWLVLHLVLLGATTNAIVVWSWHFATAILRARAPQRRLSEALRLAALNIGVLAVLAGGSSGLPWIGVAGAAVVFAAIAAHLLVLAVMLRRALPARFAIVVRYYLMASLALLTGIPAGAWMLVLPADRRARMLVFHVQVNMLGWVTLTVLGTVLTLWPTVLRAQLAAGAERAARRGLMLCGSGLTILAAGSVLWFRPLMAAGLTAFAAGVLVVLKPAVTAARQRPPTSFAALSMAGGTCWLLVTLGWDTWALLSAPDPAVAADWFDSLSVPLAAGFAAQVVAGALAYLLPMALGGGPAVVRRNAASLGRLAWPRVVAANAGLIGILCPAPAAARLSGLILLVISMAWFLVPAIGLTVRLRKGAGPDRNGASPASATAP